MSSESTPTPHSVDAEKESFSCSSPESEAKECRIPWRTICLEFTRSYNFDVADQCRGPKKVGASRIPNGRVDAKCSVGYYSANGECIQAYQGGKKVLGCTDEFHLSVQSSSVSTS
jgi:hypothetical protein